MLNLATPLAAALLLIAPLAVHAAAPPQYDDLVEVKAKRLDTAYLLPGADFRAYTKILLDPAEVAFQKNWMRDQNNSRSLTNRISNDDAAKIAAAARDGLGEIFAATFRKAGYELTTVPGPDVLRISPYIIDLYINAPDTMAPGRTRTYTLEAGGATIVIEARESLTGALLGAGFQRRIARGTGGVTWTTAVTNRADFRRLMQRWADICVEALTDLKANSPLPESLPNKK